MSKQIRIIRKVRIARGQDCLIYYPGNVLAADSPDAEAFLAQGAGREFQAEASPGSAQEAPEVKKPAKKKRKSKKKASKA